MNDRIKKVMIFGLSLMMIFTLGACRGGNSGSTSTITLTIWEDENNIEFLEDLLNNFISRDYNAIYRNAPTIRFEIIPQTEQRAIENLGRLGPTGHGPDVFAFVHNQIGAAMNAKWIAPAMNHEGVRHNHLPTAVEALTLDGVMYGYPSTGESMVLMYDAQQISESAVMSLEGIHAAGKKISWQIHEDAYYSFAFLTDVNLFGPTFDNQTALKLDTDQAVANLLYIYGQNSIARQTIISETPDTALDSIRVKESVGVITTPYLWNSFSNIVIANGGTPKVAVIPTINVDGDDITLRPYAGYKAYGVSAFTKYPHIAQAVAYYLSTAESQIRRVFETHNLPTIIHSNELDELILTIPEAQIYLTQLNTAFAMPNIVRMEDMWAPGETTMTWFYNNPNQITEQMIRSKLQEWQNTVLSKN